MLSQLLLQEVVELLRPIRSIVRADSPELALRRWLAGAGWRIDFDFEVGEALDFLRNLESSLWALLASPIPEGLNEARERLDRVREFLDGVRSVHGVVEGVAATASLSSETAELVAADLAHSLVIARLNRLPRLKGVLELLGLLQGVEVEPVSENGFRRRRERRARLVPSRLLDFLNDPLVELRRTLIHDDWATRPDAVATVVLLQRVLPPALQEIGGEFRMQPGVFRDLANLAERGRHAILDFNLPAGSGESVRFGVEIEALSGEDTTPGGRAGPAVRLTPFGEIANTLEGSGWEVDLDFGASVSDGEGLTLGTHGIEASGPADIHASFEAVRTLGLVLGSATTGIHLRRLVLSAFGAADGEGGDFGFSLEAQESLLRLSTSDFGRAIESLASFETEIDFDLGLEWSLRDGLRLSGQAGLVMPLADSLSIGKAVKLTEMQLEFAITDQVALAFRTDLALALGALVLVFDDLGASAVFSPGVPGSLGGSDLDFDLDRPEGVGVAIDAGVASGGGLINVDYENGSYSGVFDLEVLEVGVTAVFLLATRIPDRARGWSMLLSISATFQGLQLGYGFTLEGVGGVIGANRGLDAEAFGRGVKTGAIKSVLFPEDPVRDAPKILADMTQCFPVQPGQWIVGPMAKIGWGTPTLVELDVGILVQFPDPFTITLLGSLSSELPTKEKPVVVLRLDVVGTLDLTAGTLRVDASLRDSSIAGFVLTGDAAIRASFKDSPDFLMSFGGFHPAYSPPSNVPDLAPLGILLDTGDNLRLQFAAYFAMTSNTLQFGARVEFWAQEVGFSASGGMSFDALIQFKPFGLMVGVCAWISIQAGEMELLAVMLRGSLRGPGPWEIQALASFKLLGLKSELQLDASFGSGSSTQIPEIANVEALVLEGLRARDAWEAVPPEAGVSALLAERTDEDALLVHPAGGVEVRQRIAPLDRRIEHYGSAALGDGDVFQVGAVSIGPHLIDPEPAEEWFSSTQFWHLSDQEKLDAPSFEEMPAGVRVVHPEISAGEARTLDLDWEIICDDELLEAEGWDPEYIDDGSRTRGPRRRKRDASIRVESVVFAVADRETGRGLARAPDHSSARERLDRREGSRVVPAWELGGA